jgi:lysozyme
MSRFDETVIIDVSHWSGVMNWELARTKIHAAYIKASENVSHVDRQYERNKSELTRLGIAWGAYHFFRGGNDPRRQARHFAGLVGGITPTGQYRLYSQLPPVLDVEVKPALQSREKFTDEILQFLREFKAVTGVDAWIYTRKTFWDSNVLRTNIGASHPLWTAHYNMAVAEPWIPLDWAAHGWKLWQYSADGNRRGREFGAQADNMDLNIYRGGLAKFNADFGLNLRPIGDEQPYVPPPGTGVPPADEQPPDKVGVLTTQFDGIRVRSDIIASAKYGPTPGRDYPATQIWFSLPKNTQVEVLEEVNDGRNVWVRVGQRQWMAKVYDDKIFLK